ncbi:sulfur oxidation c-type cytochrome SoxA [Rhodovulum sulfidophilum]|uniref:sulfur oxidation c-type cytochrome SoxA n=1 Tax=Rhodovulum sulfidophilum TaxID=35806 RepID=UPI001920B535|nr:sulfur oxidation c-type cytochrome SoxA [Rhodovulum sulfidophilum]MBL3572719.1 sulfur oxidation c-type cytochrome SoxA [Rhodovulum sulfidophilum]MCE8430528.1 sulfur oxidation c-type cytochrome SoxA [Rhodovulum sulfidophilum]MCF4117171.1 sulfur oxidation c-type cytochrome SoxA [Rhodovulum sulfidophilum]
MKTMRGRLVAAALVCGGAFSGAAVSAGPDDPLVINGEIEIVTRAPPPAHLADRFDEIRSGWTFRTDDTQALEMDDFENSGMVFVEEARAVWDRPEGTEGKACADCHGAVDDGMYGLRAVYPKYVESAGKVRTLEQMINACRTSRMGAPEWDYIGPDMTAMVALIASVSRGMPVSVAIDGPAQSTWEKGREIYYTRYGQLDLSCASCHEQYFDHYIRADHLSQGQINGFPSYRLKNARLNAVHDRFRGCIRDTRGVPFAVGSPEFVALELYVASRGNGLSVEGPSVRN